MTRLLTRENVKLVTVAVACLLVAWTGPSIAHGVHAKFAHNADKVDGKHAVSSGASLTNAKKKLVAHNNKGQLPAKFVEPTKTIRTTHPSTAWTPNTTAPASVQPWSTFTEVAGNGGMQIPLHAPETLGGGKYGLAQVELCYQTAGGGQISSVFVWGHAQAAPEILTSSGTIRTSPAGTCDVIPVGKRAPYGATIWVGLAGGGSVDLHNVRAVWTLGTATIAPRPGKAAPRGLGGTAR
jgi:hypothetical protein